MTTARLNILSFTRGVLKVLLVLNFVAAAAFLGVLLASFALEERMLAPLARRDGVEIAAHNLNVMRAVLALGLVAVPLAHFMLGRLLAMVETVRAGDPFTALNARRLTVIAWSLFGIQLLDLVFGVVALSVRGEDAPLSGWTFNLTGWLAVLLLFVLARVFQQGTRLRDDVAGTV